MRPFTATLGLIAALIIPASLTAQQDTLVWQFYPDTDPATGLATAYAVLGIPETDSRLIELSCSYIPGDQTLVDATFMGSVSAFRSDVPVNMHWQTSAASGVENAQSVVAEEREGHAFRVGLTSRLMQQLSSADQISYTDVNTGPEFMRTAFLTPGRAEYTRFTDFCGQIQANAGRVALPDVQPPTTSALVPDVGPNITGHDWMRFTEISEDVFQTVLEISYIVPETDDVYVMGQCFIGAQGPLVAMQIAADIDGLAENAVATIRARTGVGEVMEVDGSVVGTAIEFGISGIEVVREPSDLLWLILTDDPTLQFERVGGRGGFTLTGSTETLAAFIRDCENMGDLFPEADVPPATPVEAQQGFLSCDSYGNVVSTETGAAMAMTFTNDTGAYRGLSWIDAEGQPVDFGGMEAGQSLSFNTAPGHVWMATDGPGNCRELIQPVEGQTTYRMTVQ